MEQNIWKLYAADQAVSVDTIDDTSGKYFRALRTYRATHMYISNLHDYSICTTIDFNKDLVPGENTPRQ